MNGDDVNLDRVRVALLFDRPYVYSSPARVPQLPYFAGVQDPLPQTDASGAGSVRDLLPRSVASQGPRRGQTLRSMPAGVVFSSGQA